MRTLLASLLLLSQVPALGQRPELKPAKITTKVLEYQDKVQDFSLDLLTAKTALDKSLMDIELTRDQCERIKKLVQKGFEHTNQLKGCLAAITASETAIEQQRNTIKTLTRNKEIWTIRLAAEAGEDADLKQLAAYYVSKWKEAQGLVAAQIQNAETILKQAEAYYEWAKRNALKGYINQDEYTKAMNQMIAARKDLETFRERQQEIELSLHETEVGLSKASQIH